MVKVVTFIVSTNRQHVISMEIGCINCNFFAGCCSHSAVTVFSFTCGTCLPAYS